MDSIGFALKVVKVAAYKIVGETHRLQQEPGKAWIMLQVPLNGEQSGLRLSTDDEKRALGSHRGNQLRLQSLGERGKGSARTAVSTGM